MALIHETDYGTPASTSEKHVTLTVDGRTVTVPEGTSIMRASMDAGVEIPKLCATDSMDAFGSCRICLVEIEGRAGTPASCTTPVGEGMTVRTRSDRLDAIRRGVMELYVSDHPLAWGDKAGTGASEFDAVAKAVGLIENRYGTDGRNHVAPGEGSLTVDYLARDESNPYFTYDPAQCIVCSRCVRACDEVQGTFALTIEGRGFESRMSPGMHEALIESECVSCGACVQACPTDALREKVGHRDRHPDRKGRHHLRLLRRRLLLRGRDARRTRSVAHDPLEARQGQPRPFLRQGPLRLGYATHHDRVPRAR
jgi:formate dehydrogenase major subunit